MCEPRLLLSDDRNCRYATGVNVQFSPLILLQVTLYFVPSMTQYTLILPSYFTKTAGSNEEGLIARLLAVSAASPILQFLKLTVIL